MKKQDITYEKKQNNCGLFFHKFCNETPRLWLEYPSVPASLHCLHELQGENVYIMTCIQHQRLGSISALAQSDQLLGTLWLKG